MHTLVVRLFVVNVNLREVGRWQRRRNMRDCGWFKAKGGKVTSKVSVVVEIMEVTELCGCVAGEFQQLGFFH